MAFYYNSTTNAFYDTDVFPVADLPANSVEIAENNYKNLMAHQNNGGYVAHDNSGNPLVGSWMTTAATDMVHASVLATSSTPGHVKVAGTSTLMSTSAISRQSDGTIGIVAYGIGTDELANQSVTEAKIKDYNVTHQKLALDAVESSNIKNGAVTEEKLDSVKDLEADETTLTMTEGSDEFTLSVKAGGISDTELAANAVTTAKIDDEAVTTAKIDDGAVTTAKMGNGSVTKDKLASSVIPSVLSFNVHNGTMSWGPSDNYFIIADLPADAGMIFDFTLRFYAEVQNAAPGDEWCADFVVKTGASYSGAVENIRKRFWFKDGDRQLMRFTFNGLGSGNIYIAVERQSVHPSNDPANLDMNGEIDVSGIKIFGN